MADPAQIRAARALLSWSQDTLAKRAGVGLRTITSLEADHSTVEPATVAAVVAAMEAAGIEFVASKGRRGVIGPSKV